LAAEFHSEKIPRNRLGMAFVIPRKKLLIPRHSEVYGRVHSEARNGRKWHEKIIFKKNLAPANRIDIIFLSEICFGTEFRDFSVPRNDSEQNSETLLLFLFLGTNSEYFSPLGNGSERNSEIFLFRGMIQNKIPRLCFYFCSLVQNSEHFSPLGNGSERNSESFLFRGTAGIPPEQS
jgi:hypothetical protein